MPLVLRLCLFLSCVCLSGSALADERTWQGVAVSDYVAYLIAQDMPVIYSSDLIKDDYVISREPLATDAVEILREILQPYELVVNIGPGGSLLVVDGRDDGPDRNASQAQDESAELATVEMLPEVIVSSSVYAMRYRRSGSHTFLDRELTTKLPDVGDEAIRGIDRLPGVANAGLSSKSNVRGGINNEQLLIFDGLRLYEPYHLKDFHAVSTIIDQNVISGIDFYGGGYQARYGDRMSGVIEIGLRDKPTKMQTEIGISFFNAFALSLGRFGHNDRGDWLLSARRGNLDLISKVFNSDYGSPKYEDLFAHFGWEWSDRTDIALNTLLSYDKVSLSQPDDSEDATARYRNRVIWFKAETDWTDSVFSATILSATKINNSRNGETLNPLIVVGSVVDAREFTSIGLKQDWRFDLSASIFLNAGFDVRELDATYAYDSTLTIFPPFDQIFDNVPVLIRDLDIDRGGTQSAAYLETRWKVFDDLVMDIGIRWDQQTYTTANRDSQISPRFNLLYRLGESTEIRLGYGRYYQAQEINELQVGDGEVDFGPAQHANHVVASMTHSFGRGLDLRLELYQKKYGSLLPRYENAFDTRILLPELQIDRVRIDSRSATASGAEIMLTGERRNSGLLWWLSYTWSSIEDEFQDEHVPRSWDQRHTLKAGVNWDWRKWSFSAAANIHSGWPKTELTVETGTNPDESTYPILDTTPRNQLRYPTFHTLDLRASRIFSVRRGELTGFVEISNVLDQRNLCCSEYSYATDEAGELVLTSGDGAWLPLVPSLGVIWRF
jgi:outer membrane receptor protein involved in Fe transport